MFFLVFSTGDYLCPKELSPGPQKWSPNVSKGTTVFQFWNPKRGTEMPKTSEPVSIPNPASNPASVQRKRKDNQANPDPDRSDIKKISRSNR